MSSKRKRECTLAIEEFVQDGNMVWPPMVVIRNTRLKEDENGMWLGMGAPELLKYFSSFDARKARHSYGPKGHRGISLLIFEASAVGFTEAKRLSLHFKNEGMGREEWEHCPNLFTSDGKRQLYGFMATARDMDVFNQHSSGKSKLNFELVSYQEKVVNQLEQIPEENQPDRTQSSGTALCGRSDHEARKKNKHFADFFETFDALTVEQINDSSRQWHCPACKDGKGSNKRYSLHSLVAHAKTKVSEKVKIHRNLAEILEEEVSRRGATIVPAGKSYGQWKGLNEGCSG